MRFKSSKTLVFSQSDGEVVAYNFLAKSVFQCSQDLLLLLGKLQGWKDIEEISALVPELEKSELKDALANLLRISALIQEGSTSAAMEADFERSWSWGLPAALLHYSVQDNEYVSLEQAESIQKKKVEADGKIDLFLRNDHLQEVVPLPSAVDSNPLIMLMAKRRTIRKAKSQSVSLRQLSDCLYAGLGITGEIENCVGKLPLSMTPSGGARNPYEAYVFAKNIKGLAPGIYHYAAIEHSLGRMGNTNDLSLSSLIGGQEWGDEMTCMIMLCAHLDRTMWKYEDANAYRVVLIEAGHIGQNIMLAATDHGLSACPTAAISHSRVKSQLGLSSLMQAPIYALTLSVPDRVASHSPYLN